MAPQMKYTTTSPVHNVIQDNVNVGRTVPIRLRPPLAKHVGLETVLIHVHCEAHSTGLWYHQS